MKLEHITYQGEGKANFDSLDFEIPRDLKSLLNQINGFIQYHGGLHIRGVCQSPDWHSINEVMNGKFAFYKNYAGIIETDIMFAQDCMGDQYFIRKNIIYKLYSESGDIEFKDDSFNKFMKRSIEDPIDYLELQPLLQFQNDGNNLSPGQVLHATPPFCTQEAENGVHLGAVPISEALLLLPEMAKVISTLSDGEKFDIKIVNAPNS